MSSLMLAVCVLEGITDIIASVLCCHAICCCRRLQVCHYVTKRLLTRSNVKMLSIPACSGQLSCYSHGRVLMTYIHESICSSDVCHYLVNTHTESFHDVTCTQAVNYNPTIQCCRRKATYSLSTWIQRFNSSCLPRPQPRRLNNTTRHRVRTDILQMQSFFTIIFAPYQANHVSVECCLKNWGLAQIVRLWLWCRYLAGATYEYQYEGYCKSHNDTYIIKTSVGCPKNALFPFS